MADYKIIFIWAIEHTVMPYYFDVHGDKVAINPAGYARMNTDYIRALQ